MTSDSMSFYSIINVFSGLIFPLIVLGVSIFYIIRKPCVEGFLIAGGSLINLIAGTIFRFILPSIVGNADQSISHIGVLAMIISVISFIGTILYLTGFIILIFNHLALHKKLQKNVQV
jgi:hypothetical protein